jgi:hypothetical protein
MVWRLVERPEARSVCVLCRRFTEAQFLDNGIDVLCLKCAQEIAIALSAKGELPQQEEAQTFSRRRRKEVNVSE